jgi:hypothetical protein
MSTVIYERETHRVWIQVELKDGYVHVLELWPRSRKLRVYEDYSDADEAVLFAKSLFN